MVVAAFRSLIRKNAGRAVNRWLLARILANAATGARTQIAAELFEAESAEENEENFEHAKGNREIVKLVHERNAVIARRGEPAAQREPEQHQSGRRKAQKRRIASAQQSIDAEQQRQGAHEVRFVTVRRVAQHQGR